MPPIAPHLLTGFSPIGLNEITKVSLMDRVDTKFIFHFNKLGTILEKAALHYRILEVEGERMCNYKNLYFDTKDLRFYYDHHNGKKNRTKVRMRKYVESDICYIEIKQKNNKGRTDKRRERIADFEKDTFKKSPLFLANDQLYPVISNQFKRITLVSLSDTERATFDLDLQYTSENTPLAFSNLVIAELKQATLNRNSKLLKILKKEAVNPFRISKYCMGMALQNPTLKSNAFKQKMLRINKITA